MDFLSKYGYTPDQEAISRALDLIASNLENVASEQVYKDCFSMMDLTTLKTDDTPASVTKLVSKGIANSTEAYAMPNHFHFTGNVQRTLYSTRSDDNCSRSEAFAAFAHYCFLQAFVDNLACLFIEVISA